MSWAHVPDADGRLPAEIPVFPLPGTLLLPRARLPLNIFEPRYLAMVEDAFKAERVIGMIQPSDARGAAHGLYPVGCAGRIVAFSETEDGRYLIVLEGVCRFRIEQELPQQRGYRRVRPDWTAFGGDLIAPPADIGLDRKRLFPALQDFFRRHGMSANWDALAQTGDEALTTTLAMLCPFGPAEKQALLEAADPKSRAEALLALVEMAAAEANDNDRVRH